MPLLTTAIPILKQLRKPIKITRKGVLLHTTYKGEQILAFHRVLSPAEAAQVIKMQFPDVPQLDTTPSDSKCR